MGALYNMARSLISTKNLSEEEWLKMRKQGIGGSDAAAIIGLNPFASAFSVYLDKISTDIDTKDNDYMRIGKDLEDYVAKRFEEVAGKKVRRNNIMMLHDDYDFILADIDRTVVGENALLECKVSVRGKIKDWDEVLPLHYEVQCLHYMGVTGADRCYLAVLFLSSAQFRYYVIERNQNAIDSLFEQEKRFWYTHVLARVEPPLDGSDSAGDILNNRYPGFGTKEEVILPESLAEKLEKLDDLKENQKIIKRNIGIIEQDIKGHMKDFEIGYIGERRIKWSSFDTTRVNVDKLKEKYPDIYAECCNTTRSRKFTI